MSSHRARLSSAQPEERLTKSLEEDRVVGEDLLLDAMFGTPSRTSSSRVSPPVTLKSPGVKPEHYKVVSISLYLEDIERLDAYVRELKKRGHYKANKSQVIRQALAQLDLDRISKEG